ncbi:hypothetical protein [Priestia megaterium]|uniref:hypothetical protein n=1 Tax=Priestia megaterium TaxID=1404 RepID=UPI002782FE82|nr:hypothetical protein [Priestia megaterium]MDQ0808032.1 hypothetical protein [Priestia megaterium]
MSTKYLNYEVISWQGLIQMIVYLLGRGYYHWHLIYLPESKQDKWESIDKKLIAKYGMDISKYTRRDRKKRKIANFYYLRWQHIAILLHTDGEITSKVKASIAKLDDTIDEFYDIRKTHMLLSIGDVSTYEIYEHQDKVVVKLEKQCYRELKTGLIDVAETKNKTRMIKTFDQLNGMPAWSGVYQQKKALAKFLVKQARKNGVKLSLSDLRIVGKRFVYKVF